MLQSSRYCFLYNFYFRKAREFVQQHGFDGLDLDYEFPDASDKANFALWVRDISNEFQPYGLEVQHFICSLPICEII